MHSQTACTFGGMWGGYVDRFLFDDRTELVATEPEKFDPAARTPVVAVNPSVEI